MSNQMTVGDLIKSLEKHDKSFPIALRKNHGDGYFSDHHIVGPDNFYPYGCMFLTIGDQIKNEETSND
jgi:hypothetical protein